jgi:Ca2+-binding RTX toxin-like protein
LVARVAEEFNLDPTRLTVPPLDGLVDVVDPTTVTLQDGRLLVIGTLSNDDIDILLDRRHRQIVVEFNDQVVARFAQKDVHSLEVHALAGNDSIFVDRRIRVPALLDGGEGNDTIIGGGGHTILLGGPGKDVLIGRGHRDLLIGGPGCDLS